MTARRATSLALFFSACAIAAQDGPAPYAADAARDSPRAVVRAYLDSCRTGDYTSAARYLSLPPDRRAEHGARLARRLKAVLDRHLWIDLDALSESPAGDTSDGLHPDVEELGTVPLAGRDIPVRLVRGGEESGAWLFAPETVARVDRWYAALGDRWLRDRLPEPLLRPGPLDLAWWQWIALPAVLLIAWGLGRCLAWISLRVITRVTAGTRNTWDDALAGRMTQPILLVCSATVARVLVRPLALYPPAAEAVTRALGVVVVVAFLWAAWRCAGLVGETLCAAPWATANPAARSALSLGVRLARAAILALGVVGLAAHLGYPVAGFVAGLGLGGLAFALAAQKTLENLLGSLSLAIDSPFRVGDFVRVEELVGTVEAIGLRSTRIRTLDRTLVSIPNGRLADMRLESYSARDRMRLACTIGLLYGTRAAQIRAVLSGVEGVLRAHPLIWPDAVVVRFKEFGASSLDVEVMAWFCTSSWAEFQAIREDVLLQIIEVVEGAGTGFAFPTRTVHVVREPRHVAVGCTP